MADFPVNFVKQFVFCFFWCLIPFRELQKHITETKNSTSD